MMSSTSSSRRRRHTCERCMALTGSQWTERPAVVRIVTLNPHPAAGQRACGDSHWSFEKLDDGVSPLRPRRPTSAGSGASTTVTIDCWDGRGRPRSGSTWATTRNWPPGDESFQAMDDFAWVGSTTRPRSSRPSSARRARRSFVMSMLGEGDAGDAELYELVATGEHTCERYVALAGSQWCSR